MTEVYQRGVWWVQICITNRRPGAAPIAFGFVFETDHTDLRDLFDDLIEDGMICGERIDFVDTPRGKAARRSQFILGGERALAYPAL